MALPLVGLTDLERDVVRRLGHIWNDLCLIVGTDETRDADLGELIAHVHVLQKAVMGNAAARAHPNEFRLLGGVISSGAMKICEKADCQMPGTLHVRTGRGEGMDVCQPHATELRSVLVGPAVVTPLRPS